MNQERRSNTESWITKALIKVVLPAVLLVAFGVGFMAFITAFGSLAALGVTAAVVVAAIAIAKNGGVTSWSYNEDTFE